MAKISARDARAIAAEIRKGNGFETHGALFGVVLPYYGPGRLPAEYRSSHALADYTIVSYGTPIAWRTAGEWIIPDVKYSVTTSKHQGVARMVKHWLSDTHESRLVV